MSCPELKNRSFPIQSFIKQSSTTLNISTNVKKTLYEIANENETAAKFRTKLTQQQTTKNASLDCSSTQIHTFQQYADIRIIKILFFDSASYFAQNNRTSPSQKRLATLPTCNHFGYIFGLTSKSKNLRDLSYT